MSFLFFICVSLLGVEEEFYTYSSSVFAYIREGCANPNIIVENICSNCDGILSDRSPNLTGKMN